MSKCRQGKGLLIYKAGGKAGEEDLFGVRLVGEKENGKRKAERN
jgi:hypothetical protein